MGLFDGVEKLINEHGSATILKERIDLIKDRYSLLEDKLKESEAKAERLEVEKGRFELEAYKLREKVRELEGQLEEKRSARIEEIRESILIILSKHPGANSQTVALMCRVGLEVANFHLEDLEAKKFIYSSLTIGEPIEWYLDQEGRRYSVSHGLIQ